VEREGKEEDWVAWAGLEVAWVERAGLEEKVVVVEVWGVLVDLGVSWAVPEARVGEEVVPGEVMVERAAVVVKEVLQVVMGAVQVKVVWRTGMRVGPG